MKSPCLVMMVTCSLYYSTASSHIVTAQTKDVPMRLCTQRLANLYDLLCGYDDQWEANYNLSGNGDNNSGYSGISGEEMMKAFNRNYWNSQKEDFLTRCCMRSCSYVEIAKLC